MIWWTGTHIASNIWVGPFPDRPLTNFVAVAWCAQELQPTEEEAKRVVKHSLLCPLDDDGSRPINEREILSVLATARRVVDLSKRGPVAVTCHMGINRSALVASVALVMKLDISGSEAVALMRQRRPNTLSNRVFVSYLLGLQAPSRTQADIRVRRAGSAR